MVERKWKKTLILSFAMRAVLLILLITLVGTTRASEEEQQLAAQCHARPGGGVADVANQRCFYCASGKMRTADLDGLAELVAAEKKDALVASLSKQVAQLEAIIRQGKKSEEAALS